ncbi:MAG: hypothetical protein U0805_07245 [Pirellulales bacterium]
MNTVTFEISAGIIAFIAATVLLAMRGPSLYFGLTVLCVFMVSSASLAGYIFDFVFGQPMIWLTPAHISVIQYSIMGCLAMLGGIAAAWLPRREGELRSTSGRVDLAKTPWLNARFGWFVFGVGTVALCAELVTHNIATLGTAVHALAGFSTFGLLTLFALSLQERRFVIIGAALMFYVPAVLVQSFASGHTPARVELIVPAACLAVGFRRVTPKSAILLGVLGFILLAAMAGWLQTRKMIRSGLLANLTFTEQVERFIPAWFDAALDSATDATTASNAIRERVDMTNILSMQVRHQPRVQPYAMGQTVLDSGYTLIPRAFWPGKPVVAGGSAFVTRYTGMRRDPRDKTSIGLPYQFELYANGGPICVVVGLLIVGYVCGRLERGLFLPTSSLPSLLGRVSITMTLCEGGQRTDVVLPSLIAGGLTYYALGKFIESASPELAAKLLGTSQKQPRPA